MAISERCLMTWDNNKARWTKMFKGVTYRVTCSELGVPPTKTASYRAANEWWRARQAAIIAERPPHPHADLLSEYGRRRDWAARHGEHDERQQVEAEIARVTGLGEGDDPGHIDDAAVTKAIQALRVAGIPIPDDYDPDVARALSGITPVLRDRYRRDRAGVVPAEKTLQALSVRFLVLVEDKFRAGELSASEMDTARRCVGHAVGFFGPGNEPTVISADRWEGYFLHLRALQSEEKRSREYVKKDWRYARSFVEWMADMEKLTPPRNLARRYRFGSSAVVIETFTVEEVRRLVSAAPGQTKLHLLLMLNCGMYQGDISDLRHDEVDWENGTIARQRSKTSHHGDKVPTVTYRLWPGTFALLKQYRSDDAVLALTTGQGKPWVEPRMKPDGKFTRRDGIKSNFRHVQVRLKIDKPLKSFRKTSASMLDGHSEFSRYAQFFLGHSGRSVADKHYVKPDQEQFDRAVDWLRQQYGF